MENDIDRIEKDMMENEVERIHSDAAGLKDEICELFFHARQYHRKYPALVQHLTN